MGSSLYGNTDAEHDTSKYDGQFAAKTIGQDTVRKHTDPGTELEDGREEPGKCSVGDTIGAGSLRETVHGQNLTEHALVVTVDEATHRGE